jgi:hypothetical protein
MYKAVNIPKTAGAGTSGFGVMDHPPAEEDVL